ncbi:hypothetical protein DESUT3_09470 [Desulfuromonas versatilis]|uniref:GAF domain-containing protein n=1 Tax=Desulfuromonas versatilis TaxID=2802975 RepID=A0ABM8HSD5_9BACT|nr:GAF domain-containing protein [Desulfuromonas versatilis]BCR03878.1 hypothetical protein DESUT3_09470 [Desulfuromonas versatilis]
MPQTHTQEFFRAFFEAAQAVLSTSSLEEILQALVREAVEALEVKAGSLRLVDEQGHRLELAAAYRLSDRYLNKGPLDSDRSMPEVLQGKAVHIRDAFRDPRIQYQAELREEGLNTLLSVPVTARDKVIGVLRLYTAEPRDFSSEEIEFASALAEMGGLAIANARIYRDAGVQLSSLLQQTGIELPQQHIEPTQAFKCFSFAPIDPARSLELFRTLHEITRAILSTLDSREVMALIIERVLIVMKVKGCAIRLINQTTHELELLAARGLSEQFLDKGPLHAEQSIRENLEGSPVLVEDACSDPRIEYPEEMAREGIASLLSLPIIAQRRVIGLLRLYTGAPRQFSQDEVAFLSALAEIAGVAIMNARLYEETRYDLSFWTATLGYLKGQDGPRG